jgi:hypothetical protein
VAAAGLAALPAVAAGQQGPRQTASFVFSQSRAGQSTGLRVAIDYPSEPETKPPAVQKVVVRLHPGTSIDTSVPARCEASNAELMASGAAACPSASKVGRGELDVDTGVPGPARILETDATFLNNKGELIFLLESGARRTVVRATVEGRTITTEAPPLPGGPPDGFSAVKRVRFSLDARTTGVRDYLTTPARCPASGSWTNTAAFTYRDGQSQSVSNLSRCTHARSRGDDKAPRIRVTGVPRKRCARRNFRARVRIAERWSGLRRAELRLGQRRLAVTGKKVFVRRIPVRRLRSGRHRLTVVALDRAGNRSRRTVAFRRCRG